MLAAYILELNVRDDIAYLSNQDGCSIHFYNEITSKKKMLTDEEIKESIILKSKYIYETKEKYINLLKENNLYDLYFNIELPLAGVLSSMEESGVYFDSSKLDDLKDEIEIKLDKISSDIYNMAGMEFNISSPKQVSEVLFGKLGIATFKKGKKSTSTSHLVLTKLIGEHPIVEAIIEYRNLKKLYTTYLEPLKTYVMEDGKIHTIFKQNVTRTGRLSSIEPNLQNIPIRSEEGRKIRKAFVPSENSIIVSADYSQIELRILAHISQDENLIEAFNHKEDIHTIVASDIYGTPVEAVTKTMRRTAKAVIFGIVYGISGYGLGDNLDISPKEAKKFIDKYLTLYPGVKKYMDDIVKLAYEKGSVRTIMNRKRTIEELKNTNYMIRQAGERIALNTPIQGSSADIIKKAMIDINESFKKHNLKSKMILQIHDELIFDTLKTELKDVLKIVTEVMENVYKLKVPLKIEISYGDNLYDAK
jgi:DNA polymerase-1